METDPGVVQTKNIAILMKLITIICLLGFLNYVGCYSVQNLTRNDLEEDFASDIRLLTKDNHTYFFAHGNYRIDKDSLYGIGKRLEGYSANEFEGKIAFKDIEMISGEKVDVGNTFLMLLGIGAVALVIYLFRLY